jgi:hypothetical protein
MLKSNPFPQRPNGITRDGVARCRFDLFVTLKRECVPFAPHKSRTWCHRGDKYTQEPDKMLCNLLRLFTNWKHSWTNAELYDNTRPKNDPERIVLKFRHGQIIINRLRTYEAMIADYPLPEILKTTQQ